MLFPSTEFAKLKEYLVLYKCALKNLQMRVDILLDDFSNFQENNPIEHIKTRLKTPESIAEKLHRQNYPLTADSAVKNLTDIAGMRCICAYTNDIYYISEVLKKQPDMAVRIVKDYVTYPKPSGYRSYHLILDIPIYLTSRSICLPVEIQIRTQSMEFWASLEHKAKYKFKNDMPKDLSDRLIACADEIAALDERMHAIQEELADRASSPKNITVARTFHSR